MVVVPSLNAIEAVPTRSPMTLPVRSPMIFGAVRVCVDGLYTNVDVLFTVLVTLVVLVL